MNAKVKEGSASMFGHYVNIALRYLRTNKKVAVINLSGLSVGLTVFILISIWVLDELSFDRFHQPVDRIYRICTDVNAGSRMRLAMSMPPLKEALLKDFPEVERVTRLGFPGRARVKIGERIFQENFVGYADSDLFSVFSFRLLKGDIETVLDAPYTAVITRSVARKYFEDEDPIGRKIEIDGTTEYEITGVVEDVPVNSHLRFDILRSFRTMVAENPRAMGYWLHIQFYTYLTLTEDHEAAELEAKFPEFVDAHLSDIQKMMGGTVGFFLQPLTRIHLHSRLMGELSANGSHSITMVFTGIALVVLCLACVNFINLATARSALRAREVGLRKTLGARKEGLIAQFLGESLFFSLLSLILAVGLWSAANPLFESLIGRQLQKGVFSSPLIFLGYLGVAVITGLAAGAYPAFYLSSFQPIRVLGSRLSTVRTRGNLRRGLVVFQFTVSIILLIGTATIYEQIFFMKHQDLGLDQEHVVVIPNMRQLVSQKSLQTIRREFLQLPTVINAAGCFLMPSRQVGKGIYYPEGFTEDQPQTTNRMSIDAAFIPTLDIDIVDGRNFSEAFTTDRDESLIINESAVRAFGWADPVGKMIRLKDPSRPDDAWIQKRVVGVVRDFHSLSLHRPIEPLVISYNTDVVSDLSIRVSPEGFSHTLGLIEKKWQEIAPDQPFDYFFLDESFERWYRNEERIGTIALCFSAFALFIGCLGLFGLVAFVAERRSKEIGIRKVLGASVGTIVLLMSKEFIVLAFISCILSWPLAYFGLRTWLQNFAYRIDMPWALFLLAGFFTLVLGLLSTAYQTIRAARANPVEVIKYE